MMNENTPLIDSPTPSEDAYGADVSEVGEQEGQKTHISRTFFLIAQLGIFLALADDSFVLATHGRIASQFNQLGASHWLITGYSLGYTVFLPTFGRLYDVYGAKLPLVAAYLLFAVGCTITGTSFSMGLAVFGRVLAGIGGSGMVDLISVLIADSLPIKEVAILRSYIGIVSTIGLGSGPSLGGTITTLVGWRWAFLCHVPFVLLCLGMTIWYLPSGKYSKHQPTSSTSAGHHRPSFDFPGIVLLGGTIAMFILICRVVAEGVYSARLVYVLLAIKSVFLILFLLNEGLWAKDPLVPFELVKSNGIGIACIVQVLNLSALYCLLSNIGEFFVRTEDATESLVGVYMIPAGMGFALGATPCGYLIKRTGRYKSLSIIFLCMAMLGYFLVALRWPHGPSHWELVYTVLCSTGNGGFLATQFVSFTALTPTGSSATAMTMYYISQQVGMIFGATVGATFSRAFLKYGLIRKMGTDTVVLQIIDKILRNNRFAYSLPENVQNIVQSVYMKSFGIVPVSSLSFIALSLPLVLLIRERNIN